MPGVGTGARGAPAWVAACRLRHVHKYGVLAVYAPPTPTTTTPSPPPHTRHHPPSPSSPLPLFPLRRRDLAEVELNYSFIERLMGPASARTIRQVRRLTVTAFGLCGATAVHKLMRQQAGTNSRDPWPWESAMMGRCECGGGVWVGVGGGGGNARAVFGARGLAAARCPA